MVTRADLVRQTLHTTLRPTDNSFQAILLSRTTWDTVFWLTRGLAQLMQQSPNPRVAEAGKHIERMVEFATTNKYPAPSFKADTSIVIDKRRTLLRVQMLQQKLDSLGSDAPHEERLRLQIKMETLLDLLTTSEQGVHGQE